ncbi:MAG: hypothetical protein FJW56_01770 [Actinobacteria bacterium]|nr:hypothetical protein [Actinomycetota bacterium]
MKKYCFFTFITILLILVSFLFQSGCKIPYSIPLPDIETATPVETTGSTSSSTATETTSVPLPLTHVKIWFTTSDDPNSPPVASVEAESIDTLYIWARGLVGQEGEFILMITLQNGATFQLGGDFHISPRGYTIDCGQWFGGFENRKGKVSAVAISNGNPIGDTSFIIY